MRWFELEEVGAPYQGCNVDCRIAKVDYCSWCDEKIFDLLSLRNCPYYVNSGCIEK